MVIMGTLLQLESYGVLPAGQTTIHSDGGVGVASTQQSSSVAPAEFVNPTMVTAPNESCRWRGTCAVHRSTHVYTGWIDTDTMACQ